VASFVSWTRCSVFRIYEYYAVVSLHPLQEEVFIRVSRIVSAKWRNCLSSPNLACKTWLNGRRLKPERLYGLSDDWTANQIQTCLLILQNITHRSSAILRRLLYIHIYLPEIIKKRNKYSITSPRGPRFHLAVAYFWFRGMEGWVDLGDWLHTEMVYM